MGHPGWWRGATAILLLGCSNGPASPLGNDAGIDASVVDARPLDAGNPFAFDAPSCSKTLQPGMPCSMGNMICATAVECVACPGGYVRRASSCECGGGFWNCDGCTTCETCEAGTVYSTAECTAEPSDAGGDV
jgi:hypothetical protein